MLDVTNSPLNDVKWKVQLPTFFGFVGWIWALSTRYILGEVAEIGLLEPHLVPSPFGVGE